jgi:putative ABC transport system permease protein
MATLWHDIRYGFRMLWKNPGFTAVAVLTLALGIGANTAVFSLINSVVLRPLPYKQPDHLVKVWGRFMGIGLVNNQNAISAPEFKDIETQNRYFTHVAAVSGGKSFNTKLGELPQRVEGAFVSPALLPLLGAVGLSGPVLLFVLAATLIAGLAFGILPAWRAKRVDVAQDLRASGRGALQHGARLRAGLVVAQITVSFLLLVVAGLLIRSLTWLREADPGFDSRNLLTVEVPLPQRGYSEKQRLVFFTSLMEGVRSLPGVVSAGAISQLPIRDPYNNIDIYAASAPPTNPVDDPTGNQRTILPGYFATMRIPLLAGRDVQPTDTSDSGRVVVLSKCLAETFFPGRDPLGQHVVIDRNTKVTWEVVGVAGNIKDNDLRPEATSRGAFYRVYGQQTPLTMRLAIRTVGDPMTIVAPLRTLLQKMDSQIPLAGPRTMEDVAANTTLSEKAQAVHLATFSLLALLLAAIGIYGLLVYIVTQRHGDIGIRMAVGAQPSAILGLILRYGMKLAGVGLGLGMIGAFALTRLLRNQPFGVAPTEALTFAGVMVLWGMVACMACAIPAWRAARIDPMLALRHE